MKDNITSYSPDQQKLVYSALKEIRDNDAFWQLFKIQIGDKYGIYIREDAVNSITKGSQLWVSCRLLLMS